MLNLDKGTKCLKILLLKALKSIQKSLFRCFSLFLDTYQLCKKSALRPHLEGTLWPNGYRSCKKSTETGQKVP